MAVQITRRGFLTGLIATSSLTLLPSRVRAQALPVATLPGAISVNGVVSAGTSLTYNGSTVALRSGERYVISRAASQIAASGVTRAVANRTMGMIATRVLAGAVAASPWGLAAVGIGAVAYGAYRYFTADDEEGSNSSTSNYSVIYDQNGASMMRAAVQSNCAGLPANTGSYPHSVVLGAFNGSQGCIPGFRQKVVAECTAVQLNSVVPTPTGWARAHTYDNGYVDQVAGIKEYWVFFTKNFPAPPSGGQSIMDMPPIPDVANVPKALPEQVQVKPASQAVLADVANGLWKAAVPATATDALPWSASQTVPASVPGRTPLPYTAPANPVPFPDVPPLKDLVTPVNPLVPGTQVDFEFPAEIKFPGDTGTNPDPGTDPGTNPGTPGNIDWGTPPANEPLPQVTPMTWFPTLFDAPQLSGQCSGWVLPLPKLGTSVPLNPCPQLEMITPVVRPICAIGATITAGKILMDI